MDIRLIRQLWSAVESFPNSMLSGLDDSSLSQSLVDSLKADPAFDRRNVSLIDTYIRTRIPLIREISQHS